MSGFEPLTVRLHGAIQRSPGSTLGYAGDRLGWACWRETSEAERAAGVRVPGRVLIVWLVSSLVLSLRRLAPAGSAPSVGVAGRAVLGLEFGCFLA